MFNSEKRSTTSVESSCIKAELLQEGIFFLIYLFVWEILLLKKLEIEETKTTYKSTLKTDIIKVGLVFSISNFFINKNSQGRKLIAKNILF